MIRELSQVLRSILENSSLVSAELGEAQISFERPSETFNPAQTTINLFLYDIREHRDLRNYEPTRERQNNTVIIHHPPKRIACSYLVTAWPVGGEELPLQEHRLLSQVFQVLSAYPTIPEVPFLEDTLLAGQEPAIPLVTAQVDDLQSTSEFWTALGNQLRPSITVTATLAIPQLPQPEPTPMVITQDLRLGLRLSNTSKQLKPDTEQRWLRIGGRVTDETNNPLVGVTVVLVEENLAAATDENGQYRIGSIPPGNYTLQVRQLDQLLEEVNIIVPTNTTANNYNVTVQP
ncbi:MAG: Pvc16 family protein [Crocosphaera sp.]